MSIISVLFNVGDRGKQGAAGLSEPFDLLIDELRGDLKLGRQAGLAEVLHRAAVHQLFVDGDLVGRKGRAAAVAVHFLTGVQRNTRQS